MDLGDSSSDNFWVGRRIEDLKSESWAGAETEKVRDSDVSGKFMRSRAHEEVTRTKKRRKVRVSLAMVMAAIARNRGR